MKKYILPSILFVCFVVFTILVKFIDVQPIGPQGSLIGFATINAAVHNFLGVHHFWYLLTQLFGVLAICVAAAFACIGFVQLIKRKSLFKVDRSLIVLGIVYLAVIILYVLFEKIALNVRPVITEEGLEPSYPSTHTMLILTIFGTARYALKGFCKNEKLFFAAQLLCLIIMILTVAGRLICGVHWLTDIVGGLLISSALVSFYSRTNLCNQTSL